MGAQQNPLERLKVLINSSTALVVVETVEERRALQLARTACSDLGLPMFEWSIADGLYRSSAVPTAARAAQVQRRSDACKADPSRPPGVDAAAAGGASLSSGPITNTQEPAQVLNHLNTMTIEALFVLKDFHRYLDDPQVIRRLREVAQQFGQDRRTMLITGPSVNLPPELEHQAEFLNLPLPDGKRLGEIIEEIYARLAKTLRLERTIDTAGLNAMAANLRGLTEQEADRAVSQAILTRYKLSPELVTDVLEAKKEILKRSRMLQFVDAIESMASVGGLDNLKTWLKKRASAWEAGAREFGLEPPRGVIIMGVQGCGKSLCARAIAGEWRLPLVKFDTAAVFDKYIGESEKRVEKLFLVAEELAPAVLWIDELEKVFAGSGPDSASVDAGVSSRLLGSFLSWMQERKAPVFVAATSNNVNALPPELIRKGRFDELFFVDLPNRAERRAIFNVQLKRRKQNPASFDLDRLVNGAQGFSGAEIEAALQSAMYAAFADKKAMSTDSVLAELKATVPLSATRAEDIAQLRHWAAQRAVPASAPDAESAAAATGEPSLASN